jgi:hypothetical protein
VVAAESLPSTAIPGITMKKASTSATTSEAPKQIGLNVATSFLGRIISIPKYIEIGQLTYASHTPQYWVTHADKDGTCFQDQVFAA